MDWFKSETTKILLTQETKAYIVEMVKKVDATTLDLDKSKREMIMLKQMLLNFLSG